MIVFWTTNDQRTKRFLREDVVHCHRGFAILNEVYLYHASRRTVKAAALFNDETTPWTYIGLGPLPFYGRMWLASKHPLYPRQFILSNGDIVDLNGNLIMEAAKP